jgi:hypothetical protein
MDHDAFVDRSPELSAERPLAGHGFGPPSGIPSRLGAKHDRRETATSGEPFLQATGSAEVTRPNESPVSPCFPFGENVVEPLRRTDRRSRDDARARRPNESDDGVPLRTEPMFEARVDDLVRRRVPTVLQDKFASAWDVRFRRRVQFTHCFRLSPIS